MERFRLSNDSCCFPMRILALICGVIDMIATILSSIYFVSNIANSGNYKGVFELYAGFSLLALVITTVHIFAIFRESLGLLKAWIVLGAISLFYLTIQCVTRVGAIVAVGGDLALVPAVFLATLVTGYMYFRVLIVNTVYYNIKDALVNRPERLV